MNRALSVVTYPLRAVRAGWRRIFNVDCRFQASFQRAIDVLVERGVLDGGDVKAITDACEAQLADTGPP